MSGYLYNKYLAGLHFWLFFIGVNLVFFPQHFLGMQGMPRRYVDYNEAFTFWNQVSTMGAFVTLAGVLVFLIWVIEAFIVKRKAGDNYWGEGANTLEWTLPSPPRYHEFNTLPRIK
jgi:cytochrome c oxidase subunit 1